MWACCAAPTKSSTDTEVVPMDMNAEPRARQQPKVIRGPGMATFTLTEVEVPRKEGLMYDMPDQGRVEHGRFEDHISDEATGGRFNKYHRRLSTPAWEKDEQQKSWVPRISRQDNSGRPMDSARGRSSPREGNNKDGREERLKQLMAEFKPMLERGIRVNMVDASTQLFSQCLLKLDMADQTIHLTAAFMPEQSFNIKDMAEVYKGKEFSRKLPGLAHVSSTSIGMEFQCIHGSPGEPTCLHFEDTTVRNDFFAYMKVVRMAAENVGANWARR